MIALNHKKFNLNFKIIIQFQFLIIIIQEIKIGFDERKR